MNRRLSVLERELLGAVEERLSEEAAGILRTQLREVNLVQRDPSGQEVRLYRTRWKFFQREFSSYFRNRSPQVCLARIRLYDSESPEYLATAEIWLVSGRVFSIEYPLRVPKGPDMAIRSVQLLIDPQAGDGEQGKVGDIGAVTDWLRRLGISEQVLKSRPALPEEKRASLLQGLQTRMPDGWVRMVERFDGFTAETISVHGLGDLPRAQSPDETLLILAESNASERFVAIAYGSQTGEAVVIDHEGGREPPSGGGSFEACLKALHR